MYEVWHFEKTSKYDQQTKSGGICTEYINTFLKLHQWLLWKRMHTYTHTHTHTHTKGSKRKHNIMKNHIQNNRREKKVNKNKI